MITLEIVNASGRAVPRAVLPRVVRAFEREFAKRAKRKARGELTIAFLDELNALALNKKYRERDYATDVLSFAGEAPSLGELAICPAVISRQAREHGLTVRDELAYMIVHGLLHLLGYDHEKGGRAAARMLRLQDDIWESPAMRRATRSS